MINNNKNFKSIDEQIELLKSKKLNINNEDRLKWYLKSFNYQNFVNGYNDFFMELNNRKTNRYKIEANSEGLIELFNFDRTISKHILSTIQNIERKISTAIAYTIAQELKIKGKDETGKIFNYKYNDLTIKKIFNDFENEEEWNKFIDDFNDGVKRNKGENIFKNFSNISEIPIWSSIIYVSFGSLLNFLKKIKKNIFYEMLKNSCLYNWNQVSRGEFLTILSILKDIRNRICHNNVLYNITITSHHKICAIKNFLKIEKKIKKIGLFQLNKIIEMIDSGKEIFLNNKINELFINSMNSIDENIKKDIKNKINIGI